MNEPVVVIAVQAELPSRQIAGENAYSRLQVLVELWKLQVQLHRTPKPHRRFLRVLAPNQQIQAGAMSVQQVGGDVRANVAC